MRGHSRRKTNHRSPAMSTPPVKTPHLTRQQIQAMITAGVPALSVKPAWAWLIVNGHKLFENRDWKPGNPARRWLEAQLQTRREVVALIHAGRSLSVEEYGDVYHIAKRDWGVSMPMEDETIPRGGIVGAVMITSWHPQKPYLPFAYGSGLELQNACTSDLVPCKGALGFFKPQLESEVKP